MAPLLILGCRQDKTPSAVALQELATIENAVKWLPVPSMASAPQGERVIGGQVNGVTGPGSRQSDPRTGDNWPAHCPQAVRWTAASGAPVTPRAKI